MAYDTSTTIIDPYFLNVGDDDDIERPPSLKEVPWLHKPYIHGLPSAGCYASNFEHLENTSQETPKSIIGKVLGSDDDGDSEWQVPAGTTSSYELPKATQGWDPAVHCRKRKWEESEEAPRPLKRMMVMPPGGPSQARRHVVQERVVSHTQSLPQPSKTFIRRDRHMADVPEDVRPPGPSQATRHVVQERVVSHTPSLPQSSKTFIRRDRYVADVPEDARTRGPRYMADVPEDVRAPACEVTAEEILTYNPKWLQMYPAAMMRLVENGWTQNKIAAYINYARHRVWDQACRANSYNSFIERAAKKFHHVNEWQWKRARKTFQQRKELSTASWQATKGSPQSDCLLVNLATGVVHHPTEQNGQHVLTRCIAYAVDHPEENLKISDIPRMNQQHGFDKHSRLDPKSINHDIQSLDHFNGLKASNGKSLSLVWGHAPEEKNWEERHGAPQSCGNSCPQRHFKIGELKKGRDQVA